MKKILPFLLAVSFANPAMSQSWVGPGEQTITITGAHTIGDGSDAHGGIAPALEDGSNPQEAANEADNFTLSDWYGGTGSRDTTQPEAKARFHCHFSHELPDDPVLFPGQPGASHLHSFFGNTLTDANSTYTSLRTTGWSTCSGGPINRTGYWYPSVRKTLDSGLAVTVIPERIIVYYVGNGKGVKDTRIPRGFSYISGFNPSDPDNTKLRDAILAANTAAGWTRYSFYASVTPTQAKTWDGFKGWRCDNATYSATSGKFVPYLVNENGEDMFVKTYGAQCGPGRISFVVDAPRCWDGKNRNSPDGRSHVSHVIHDNNNGQDFCPDGWYFIPNFEGSFIFTSKGSADYTKWYFSSDRMNAASTPADPTNRSMCRRVGPYFCNGETGHFDWLGAWSYGTQASPGPMLRWLKDCTGVETYPGVTRDPAACDDNTIDATNKLLGNAQTVPASCLADPLCPKQNEGVGNYQIWLSKPEYASGAEVDRYVTPSANTQGNFTITHPHN